MVTRQSYISGARGNIIVAQGASPGAGNNYVLSPHAYTMSRLLYFDCLFTADANAANRLLTLSAVQGAIHYFAAISGVIATATDAFYYTWALEQPYLDLSATIQQVNNTLQADFLVKPGDTINLTVGNKQAGDAITAIVYALEEYHV